MLRLVTGPFHPTLELALVDSVQQLKASDPLTPFTIVVPSDSLRRRLLRLLCVEHGCALLDVHLLTFHQFAVRLLREAGQFDSARIRPEWFFHELVHLLLKRSSQRPSNEPSAPWSNLADMPGAWGALRATLNDLQEARVDPERVLDAVSQTGLEPNADLARLMSLYRVFLHERDRMQVTDHEGLAGLAEPLVAASAFLQRQQGCLYYGFYDATQIQLDLFQAVARAYPTTLFFPLIKAAPAYAFSERFYERYLLGLVGEVQDEQPICTSRHREHAMPLEQTRRIMSVSGPVDELTVVAKDILSLVEEHGYGFHEIGVVARTLTGYDTLLPRIFEQHAIPYTTTMARSLYAFPLVSTCLQMLDLRVNGFRRDRVLELVSSPFFRFSSQGSTGSKPRPDLWDAASRRLGITKGLEEWRRLTAYLDKDLPLRDDDENDVVGPRIASTHIRNLWSAVSALAQALEPIPEIGTWEEYSEQVLQLCERWLDASGGTAESMSDSQPVIDSLKQALTELRWLSAIQPEVSLVEFTAALHRVMETTLLPIGPSSSGGVQVLDAMAARGGVFRALYVIGLNEKVFPRHIREDAFLRDRVRRFLDIDLGFKIQEKLGGYDEEQLLFALLCGSAREQLTLVYQRTDHAGRALLPSSYLVEAQRMIGGGECVIPRRLTAKFQETPQYHSDRLTPAELTTKCLLQRQVPRRLLESSGSGRLVARGLVALPFLDGSDSSLGVYDGITGPIEAVWHRMTSSGVSPTSLQEYAICPFRYFAKQILNLRPLTLPETIDQVGPAELGTLAHSILRRCLESLRHDGYFQGARSEIDPVTVLRQAAREEFVRFANTHPIGYPLVWRLHQERLVSFLSEVLRDDLEEMAQEGWEPVLFEEDFQGTLKMQPPLLSVDVPEIPVTGRLDRVDWSASRNAYRIIDYKFKIGRTAQPIDTNLVMGAARATRLQPPLYLTMTQALAARMPDMSRDSTCHGVWFYYLAPSWQTPLTRIAFPGNAWSSALTMPMMQAITHVLSGIRSGRFFMYTSEFCNRCDYRVLCRKSHQPTVWRGRLDHAVVNPYRLLRSATVRKGEAVEPFESSETSEME